MLWSRLNEAVVVRAALTLLPARKVAIQPPERAPFPTSSQLFELRHEQGGFRSSRYLLMQNAPKLLLEAGLILGSQHRSLHKVSGSEVSLLHKVLGS